MAMSCMQYYVHCIAIYMTRVKHTALFGIKKLAVTANEYTRAMCTNGVHAHMDLQPLVFSGMPLVSLGLFPPVLFSFTAGVCPMLHIPGCLVVHPRGKSSLLGGGQDFELLLHCCIWELSQGKGAHPWCLCTEFPWAVIQGKTWLTFHL